MPVHINLVKSNIKNSCPYGIACKLILLVCLLLPVVYQMFTEKQQQLQTFMLDAAVVAYLFGFAVLQSFVWRC